MASMDVARSLQAWVMKLCQFRTAAFKFNLLQCVCPSQNRSDVFEVQQQQNSNPDSDAELESRSDNSRGVDLSETCQCLLTTTRTIHFKFVRGTTTAYLSNILSVFSQIPRPRHHEATQARPSLTPTNID
mmetsp:Transcript_37823/g.150751  ORF Transcript_37823/g.150751 Transcript_37823/m.150751 type:complete len:130 (-) Transcript_37823:111-500(-)